MLCGGSRKKHLDELGVKAASTAFFGYESADAANKFIAEIVIEPATIDRVYKDDYLEAAAAQMQYDPAAFERRGKILKDKGVRRTRWEKQVEQKFRTERDRLNALSKPSLQGGGGSSSPALPTPALPGDIDLRSEPRAQVKGALDALVGANLPPFLFRRAKALVRLRMDDDDAELGLLDRDGLFAELNDAVGFFQDTRFGTTFKFPPKTLVSVILGSREFPFPAIERLRPHRFSRARASWWRLPDTTQARGCICTLT
jgi:hypothetical protein